MTPGKSFAALRQPEQRLWQDDIHDEIREVMSLRGSLSIERICELVPDNRPGVRS